MANDSETSRTINVAWAGGFGVQALAVPGPYKSLAAMRKANKAAGGHYFDAASIRFFNSKPCGRIVAGRFFIDSIQFVDSSRTAWPREYKIVAVDDGGRTLNVCLPPADWNGDERDMGAPEFTEKFASEDEARQALKSILSK